MRVGQRAKATISFKKPDLEAISEELDQALVQAFPGPEPMSVLLTGGACLLFQGMSTGPTGSVDMLILEMMGSQERTLIFRSPIANRVRRIIEDVGRRHGFKRDTLSKKSERPAFL